MMVLVRAARGEQARGNVGGRASPGSRFVTALRSLAGRRNPSGSPAYITSRSASPRGRRAVMDLGLREKVVIVTGGARGIGAAVTRALAAEGVIPVILGHD